MKDTWDYQVVLENNVAVAYRSLAVHTIKMGDVEDPDLFVGQHIHEWMQTEQAKWLVEHSVKELEWHRTLDHVSYGYIYKIVARLKESDLTFWQLKWKS